MDRRGFLKLAAMSVGAAAAAGYGGYALQVAKISGRFVESISESSELIDNDSKVLHLVRRVSFGEPPERVEYLRRLGFASAADHLINYENVPNDHLPQTPDITMAIPMEGKNVREEVFKLIWWWVDRMVRTHRPLEERMTLFWHNHFATSIRKVRSPYLMYLQNQTLRRLAMGKFRDLLMAITEDPAMLIWLDGARNRRGNPNENYAREIMEVFTIGRGEYTERDVKEGARALTGYVIDQRTGKSRFVQRLHDGGTKTFLGHSGNLGPEEVVDILASHPATARNVSRKIFEYLAYSNPGEDVVERLSEVYLRTGGNIKEVVASIIGSEEFISESAILSHVKSPVEYVVTALRSLEASANSIKALRSMDEMGQVPFAPPSVFGWPTDLAWIDTASLLARYNFPLLIQTSAESEESRLDPNTYFGNGIPEDEGVSNLIGVLLPNGLPAEVVEIIQQSTASVPDPLRKVRNVVRLTMASPFYNLN